MFEINKNADIKFSAQDVSSVSFLNGKYEPSDEIAPTYILDHDWLLCSQLLEQLLLWREKWYKLTP
jgi:hypothetical protein